MNKQMPTITAVIIDDEPGNIITLTELLKLYCPEVTVEATAADPVRGLEIINRIRPALVFLDIEMPYGNGFQLLDKLSPVTFEVIFVTAFNNYAIKAFKYAAIDYILKPVNITELKEAVKKASRRIDEKNINARVGYLLNNLKPENKNEQKIALSTEGSLFFENLNNIMYIEASGSYSNVFIKDQKKKVVTKKLKEFEDILPEHIFCRVHHSYIINTNFIKQYFKGRSSYVQMHDGTNIAIAVRKKDSFLQKFIQ
jgi:two-component system LytT family response regulator